MSHLYILDGHNPVEEKNVIKWGYWIEKADRHVAVTEFPKCRVSTVFLGINHNLEFSEPILFETMVFWTDNTKDIEEISRRCSTWNQAEKIHMEIVEQVKEMMRIQ